MEHAVGGAIEVDRELRVFGGDTGLFNVLN